MGQVKFIIDSGGMVFPFLDSAAESGGSLIQCKKNPRILYWVNNTSIVVTALDYNYLDRWLKIQFQGKRKGRRK
jgi:hypothetical protein